MIKKVSTKLCWLFWGRVESSKKSEVVLSFSGIRLSCNTDRVVDEPYVVYV